jgi:hypothetical protein
MFFNGSLLVSNSRVLFFDFIRPWGLEQLDLIENGFFAANRRQRAPLGPTQFDRAMNVGVGKLTQTQLLHFRLRCRGWRSSEGAAMTGMAICRRKDGCPAALAFSARATTLTSLSIAPAAPWKLKTTAIIFPKFFP